MKVKSVLCPMISKKQQPPILFYAHMQVTFKVWRQANFVTFFPNKNLKILCNIDKF